MLELSKMIFRGNKRSTFVDILFKDSKGQAKWLHIYLANMLGMIAFLWIANMFILKKMSANKRDEKNRSHNKRVLKKNDIFDTSEIDFNIADLENKMKSTYKSNIDTNRKALANKDQELEVLRTTKLKHELQQKDDKILSLNRKLLASLKQLQELKKRNTYNSKMIGQQSMKILNIKNSNAPIDEQSMETINNDRSGKTFLSTTAIKNMGKKPHFGGQISKVRSNKPLRPAEGDKKGKKDVTIPRPARTLGNTRLDSRHLERDARKDILIKDIGVVMSVLPKDDKRRHIGDVKPIEDFDPHLFAENTLNYYSSIDK